MQTSTLRSVERAGADAVSDTRHSDLAVIAARVLFAYAISSREYGDAGAARQSTQGPYRLRSTARGR